MKAPVSDGRTFDCSECGNRRICSSCRSRIRYGKPNPNGAWDSLRMTEDEWRRLLMSAAEFDELATEYGEEAHAVEYVDWLYATVVERAA